jgi:hypothetical protein
MEMTTFRTNHRTGRRFPVYESESDHIRRVLAEEGFLSCPWCYAPILVADYPAHQAMELAKVEHERQRTSRYGQGTSIDEYLEKQ